jgi:hypothetical protein
MNPELSENFFGLQPLWVVEQPQKVLLNSVTMKALDYT